MFISLILFTACKVDRPENRRQYLQMYKPNQVSNLKTSLKRPSEKPSPTKDGLANVNISSEAVQIQLPSLTPKQGWTVLLSSRNANDSGCRYDRATIFAGNKVDFISVKGFDLTQLRQKEDDGWTVVSLQVKVQPCRCMKSWEWIWLTAMVSCSMAFTGSICLTRRLLNFGYRPMAL